MASYNTVITNEGAALLASVIANQGTLTLSEMRFSTTDYDGVEQTLTVGTFGGVFITAAASGSVVDATTIKVGAQFDNSGIVGDHPLYSIGIVGTDGNTTALIAVCTTTNPDIIRAALTGVSTYAFNVNLAVSSTSNITVTGTTAAVLYDIDVVDNLTSPATDKPLSANMGRVLGENIEAILDVYGAKNCIDSLKAGAANAINNDGTFTNTVADSYTYFYMYVQGWDGATFKGNLANAVITQAGEYSYPITIPSGTKTLQIIHNGGTYDIRTSFECNVEGDYIISFRVLGADPSTIGGLSFDKVMLRDARIIDPTFAPFAETNLQLTKKTSGLSNENLLDNPFFTVNQRGFSSAIFQTGNVYTVDRWLIIGSPIGGSVSLSSSGMYLSRTGVSALGYLTQFLEDLTLGKPYTLSVLFANGTIESKTGIINSIADSISFSFANGLGSTRVYYFSGGSKWTVDVIVFAGSEFTIRAIKLEVGSVSTLANDVEPDQATELLKCQRYFYRLKALSSFAFFSSGVMNDATTYWGIINLPVPMRATPQITSAGSVYIRQGTNVLVSSITCGLRSPNILSIFAVAETSLTVGTAALLALDSTSSYIDFSADL